MRTLTAELLRRLDGAMRRDLEQVHSIIRPAAWLAIIGSPIFWALWSLGVPDVEDPLSLRMATVVACLPGAFYPRLPALLRRYFHLYWHAAILFCVPYVFSYLLLLNDFHTFWLVCHLGGFILLMEVVPSMTMYALVTAVGIAAAVLVFTLVEGSAHWALLPAWYPVVLIYGVTFTFVILHATLRKQLAAAGSRQAWFAFPGTIAHEMRKPLAISLQTLLLVEEGLRELTARPGQAVAVAARLRRVVATGQRAITRGDRLLAMMLRNLREDGLNPATFIELSLAGVVRQAVDSYPYARGQRERVRVRVSDEVTLRGDETLLIHVVYNLLQNALRFERTPGAPRISLVVTRRDRRITLWVSDRGPGFDRERLPRVRALLDGHAMTLDGALGLAFCQRVVAAMGGRIEVCNRPQGGARIALSWPCR